MPYQPWRRERDRDRVDFTDAEKSSPEVTLEAASYVEDHVEASRRTIPAWIQLRAHARGLFLQSRLYCGLTIDSKTWKVTGPKAVVYRFMDYVVDYLMEHELYEWTKVVRIATGETSQEHHLVRISHWIREKLFDQLREVSPQIFIATHFSVDTAFDVRALSQYTHLAHRTRHHRTHTQLTSSPFPSTPTSAHTNRRSS